MTAPVQQNIAALDRGNVIRVARAGLRVEVVRQSRASGCDRVADLLDEPPEELLSAAIYDVLLWINRMGRSRARSILAHADEWVIGERRRIRDLTPRQRAAVADYLRASAEAARANGTQVR